MTTLKRIRVKLAVFAAGFFLYMSLLGANPYNVVRITSKSKEGGLPGTSTGTAFLIDSHYVITAEHCVGEATFVDGFGRLYTEVQPIFRNLDLDIVLLRGSLGGSSLLSICHNVKPLKFANEVEVGETYTTYSYIGGSFELTEQEVKVVSMTANYLYFSPAPVKGQSGSPIFNKEGEVVGMIIAAQVNNNTGLAIRGKVISDAFFNSVLK